jgi:hypothetical protein
MRIGIRGLLRPVAASLAILSVGCGTTYSPREPGRIYFAISRQDEILMKDGKKFSLSAFSGDLAEAVSGNPAAEEHARTYVRRQRIAGVLGGLGLAALVPAYVCWAESITGVPENRRSMEAAASLFALGFLVGIASAAIVGESGMGHLYDAINIYNDDLSRR